MQSINQQTLRTMKKLRYRSSRLIRTGLWLTVLGTTWTCGITLESTSAVAAERPSAESAATGSTRSSSAPGRSAAMLPDGRWLLTGGTDVTGPATTIRLRQG